MRILALTLKDLLQIVRDWKAAVFLLISPIVFTLFFGLIFRGGSEGESDPRLPVGYLDLDNQPLSLSLGELLRQSNVIRLEPGSDLEDLQGRLQDGELAAVIVIPAGYSAALQSAAPLTMTLQAEPASNAGGMVGTALRTAIGRLQSAESIAQAGMDVYTELLPTSSEINRDTLGQQVLQDAVAAWRNPPITAVLQSASALEQPEKTQANPYAHSAPGMMAQFAIAGLIGAAEVLVRERKTRTLQRLLTTAVQRVEILLGHYLAMFVLIFTQFALLIAFGQIFLGLNYAHDWLATALVAVSMALCAAGMGLLIGVLSKSEEQVILLTLMPMFVLSGLGGAWMPLEVMPKAVQAVGHFSPVAWMMDGFQGILVRGQGWQDVLAPAGMLLGFAALFSVLGVIGFWRAGE